MFLIISKLYKIENSLNVIKSKIVLYYMYSTYTGKLYLVVCKKPWINFFSGIFPLSYFALEFHRLRRPEFWPFWMRFRFWPRMQNQVSGSDPVKIVVPVPVKIVVPANFLHPLGIGFLRSYFHIYWSKKWNSISWREKLYFGTASLHKINIFIMPCGDLYKKRL